MNYQQRNRALFECIRERYERTDTNLRVDFWTDVDFTYVLYIIYLISVLLLRPLMHEFARCSR